MAKQTINIGTAANDGTGDPLRSAFTKVNSNFTELYEHDANNVLPGQTGNSGKYLTTDGTSTSWATLAVPNLSALNQSIIPDQDVQYDLGSPTNKFRDLYLSGNTITLGTQTLSSTSSGVSLSGDIEYTNIVRIPTGITNFITGETIPLNQSYNVSASLPDGSGPIGPFLGNSYASIVYAFPMPATPATFTFTYDNNRYLETITMTSAGGNIGGIDDFEVIWNPDPILPVTPILNVSEWSNVAGPAGQSQEIWNSDGKTLYFNFNNDGVLETVTGSGWTGADVVPGYWWGRFAALRLPNGNIVDYVIIQEDCFGFLWLNVTYNDTTETIKPFNASTTLQLVPVPKSSIGKAEDKFGMYAMDTSYFYTCIKDHDPNNISENIWKRSPWSGDTW